MDDFNTIRLKKKTLHKFKKYSQKVSPSYSETLDYMMAFFEDNNLSPYDTLQMSTSTLSHIFNKRMDAVEAILRTTEKEHIKPTKKLLESLFEEMDAIQNPMEEVSPFKEPTLITENEELSYYRNAYHKEQIRCNELKHKMKTFFEQFKQVKNTFSATQYVLKISEQELSELKKEVL
tara:strand:+ start:6952 stop:7482 length:531 start_codon:yes stop_codon:yes gene_type:complete